VEEKSITIEQKKPMSLYEKALIQVENVESEVDSFNESRSDVTSF
jgi:hypothetical protein